MNSASLTPLADLILNEPLDCDQPDRGPVVDAVISGGRLPERADLGHDFLDEWWIERDDSLETRITIRR